MAKRRFTWNLRALIEIIEKLEGLFDWELCYDGRILHEVCACYKQDMDGLRDPNLLKQAAHIAFWLKKLKPVREGEHSAHFANEVLAFTCAHVMLASRYQVEKRCLYKLFKKIMYLLRYHVLSPQTLFHLYESLYSPVAAHGTPG